MVRRRAEASKRGFLAECLRRPVLGDGAMGTELQRAGLEPGGCGDLWNLEHPGRVEEIQRAYLEAGAEFLLTNTFGSNRFVLSRYEAAGRVADLNRAGARIAQRAAGDRAIVLGDIGPFGGFLEPLGEYSPDEVHAAFLDQARALVEGGVDGILVETMTAPEEMALAIRASREAGAAFVIGTFAFDRTASGDYRTMMGTTVAAAVVAALGAGADAVGANCGTNLSVGDYAVIARLLRSAVHATVPVLVQMNAGQPVLEGTRIVYRETPARMAAGVPLLLDAGANAVGGCCGTRPEHVRAFRGAIDIAREG
jgi:5-methyltetrahydrofolate--homocysteine methyltransferase